MGFIQRRVTTTKSKYLLQNFNEKKKEFLNDVATTVGMEEIPPQLIFNWDQTGIKLVLSMSWIMNEQGAKRVELVGISDKRQITAVFCGNLLGSISSSTADLYRKDQPVPSFLQFLTRLGHYTCS